MQPLFFRGFTLHAGDGGDALLGNGGTGGFIGSTGQVTNTFDPITGLPITDFVGSIFLVETGNVRLFAGLGGDGFTRGGNGGNITGVSLRAAIFIDPNDDTGGTLIFTDVRGSLVAGDGGRGVSSSGGNGGTLSNNSIEEGLVFFAGDGGPGRIGGQGGFVLGNGSAINDTYLTDTDDTFPANLVQTTLNVVAGNGGDGTRRGGDAGGILHFRPFMLAETDLGRIRYVSGNGGNAVSGPGGAGGSVLDSSPQANAFIERDIFVQAGDGGDGTTGGPGGSIDSFNIQLAAPSKAPGLLTFTAGNGGFGTAGNGGIGGSVSNIIAPSRGLPNYQDFTVHQFNRIVAGNGGGSSAKRGGAGGSVHDIVTSSDQEGYAIIAGAGGDGLRRGGRGGDLLNVDINLGASTTAKALFISGAGGAATAFVVNPRDDSPNQPQNSFGGQVGRGGDGGSINGVTQRGNIDIHMDLISGNGGDTINYGTVIDPTPNVGRGGSISNILIAGNIGNIDPTVAIQSYNDFLGGQTVAQYVDLKFRDPLAPAGPNLTDADGNVGIVVGAAGRNKAVVLDPQGHPHIYVTQPSTGAKNGDLINLTTRNLMSAVAGSVDRIAAIQTCMNIQILNGEVGSDKGIINVAEYLDADGKPTVNGRPVRDGRLIDGALVCKALLDGGGNNTTLSGRVFFL